MRRIVLGGVVLLAVLGAYRLGSQAPRASISGAADDVPARATRVDGSTHPGPQGDAPIASVRAASRQGGAADPVDGLTSPAALPPPRSIAASFMTEGMLNPRAMSSVDADDFGKLIAQARREADADALRTTDAYRRILGTGLVDLPGEPRVDDMACAGRVCLLAVTRRQAEGSALDWMAMLGETTRDTSLKVGAIIEGEKALPGGRLETRVVFAIGTSGIVAAVPRR